MARAKFLDWPADAPEEMPTSEVIKMYKAGFAGAVEPSAEVLAEFIEAMSHPVAEDAMHQFGLADSGAGKLVAPFVHVLEMFPSCWPGRQGQALGDCVSWSTRNAALTTMVCDIIAGQPDEKTGKVEEKPEVPEAGIADGVLSTEAFYWWRGYNGDGWSCPAAATVATRKSGLFVRKNYPDLGVDLTNYSGRNAKLYGSRAPGSEIAAVGAAHLIHQATSASATEAVRDLLFNGYGVSTCGSEGFADTRDENGVSKRSGSWAHAIVVIAVDDRDVIKQKYGGPLELYLNSWAKWNRGPRDILQSAALVPPEKKQLWIDRGIVNPQTGNVMIPEGSFWARESDVTRREKIAFSGVNGWPARVIPTFNWDT